VRVEIVRLLCEMPKVREKIGAICLDDERQLSELFFSETVSLRVG
jgi:hypothetical protein